MTQGSSPVWDGDGGKKKWVGWFVIELRRVVFSFEQRPSHAQIGFIHFLPVQAPDHIKSTLSDSNSGSRKLT